MSDDLWCVSLAVRPRDVETCDAVLSRMANAVTGFELEPDRLWRLEAWIEHAPDTAKLEKRLRKRLDPESAEAVLATLAVEKVAQRDWAAENRASFAPLAIGRFFIHPSHFAGPIPANAHAIRLDAGLAFGTGHHETTAGCLQAIERLGKRGRPRRVLDMGTGSGVLAIAAARQWRVPVLAADIDPRAVGVARENAAQNGVAGFVHCRCAERGDEPAIGRAAPFDLVIANILAGPLETLAPALVMRTALGGRIVLAGLLAWQERQVLQAYQAQGAVLVERIVNGEWPVLVLAV
jgi:ribosomal protein L11 methyltransferase